MPARHQVEGELQTITSKGIPPPAAPVNIGNFGEGPPRISCFCRYSSMNSLNGEMFIRAEERRNSRRAPKAERRLGSGIAVTRAAIEDSRRPRPSSVLVVARGLFFAPDPGAAQLLADIDLSAVPITSLQPGTSVQSSKFIDLLRHARHFQGSVSLNTLRSLPDSRIQSGRDTS
jgi:hypothetical protein